MSTPEVEKGARIIVSGSAANNLNLPELRAAMGGG
jgi:hypothetical protein